MDPVLFWYWTEVHEHLYRVFYLPAVEEIGWCIAKDEEAFSGEYRPPPRRVRIRWLEVGKGRSL